MMTSDLYELCPLQKELEDLVRKEHASIDAQSGLGASNSEGACQHRCPVGVGGLQPHYFSFPQEFSTTSHQGGAQDH